MRRVLAFCALCWAALVTAQDRAIVGYYPNRVTYGRNYQVLSIPGSKLDVINYAFARIDTAGRIQLSDVYADVQKRFAVEETGLGFYGCLNQLVVLKKRFPHLRTVISVADNASEFSNMASTAAKRSTFSASVINFIKTYKFDGVDIDWEFPVTSTGNAADKPNFTLLMQQLRDDLDAQGQIDGKHYLLTAAVSGGYPEVNNLEVASLCAEADWLNVMIYDFAGSWSTSTGHLAPLYGRTGPTSTEKWNANYTFSRYLAAGAPPQKLFFGVPFYAKGWRGVPSTNNGLYQTLAGQSSGTWGTGTYGYNDVVGYLANSPSLYSRYWDSNVQSTWVYAETLEGGLFLTYEDVTSIFTKATYAVNNAFGGMMAWELSGDVPSGPNSLLQRMDSILVPKVSPKVMQTLVGSVFLGSVQSLVRVDADELAVAPNFNVARGQPNYDLVFDGVVRVPNPTALTAEIVGRYEGGSGVATLEAFDWSTGAYASVGTFTLLSTNQTFLTPLPNPLRFIDPTSSRVRLRMKVTAPTDGGRTAHVRLNSVGWRVPH